MTKMLSQVIRAAIALVVIALSTTMAPGADLVHAQDYCDGIEVPTCELRINRDILFVLDASESMDPKRFFEDAINYMMYLICALPVETTNQIGLTLFSSSIKEVIPLEIRNREQWKTAIEKVRADKTSCCTCCTPTAEAIQSAVDQFKLKGRPRAYKITFIISDGLPYQNKNSGKNPSPWTWKKVRFATYKYITVPSTGRTLKRNGVRLIYLGVPNKNGDPPNVDYFAGIPDPKKMPKKQKNSRKQCEKRGRDNQCVLMDAALYPITSEPVEDNLFFSNTWDVNSLIDQTVDKICLMLPTSAPTFEPTTLSPTSRSPTQRPSIRPTTRSPTKRPTQEPTTEPTPLPTVRPTLRPTSRSPTRRPSERPTSQPTPPPTRRPTNKPSRFPTLLPTVRPTKRPTRLPTRLPTRRPTTRNPTKEPTRHPSRFPTDRPTQRPTFLPTRRPTRLPTFSPYVPDLDHLDLYMLLDLSGSMITHNQLCAQVNIDDPEAKLDLTSASKCWQLFLAFTLKLANQVAKLGRFGPMGWQSQHSDPSKGLRVNVIGFACSGNQKVPEVFDIVQLDNNYDSFKAKLNQAALNFLPDGGTCPSQAIDLTAMRVMLQNRGVRPYQAALVLTDGVFYDVPKPETAEQSLFYYKVQTFAVGIAIPKGTNAPAGLTPEMMKTQAEELRKFTNHVPGRVYNLGSQGFALLQPMAIELALDLPSQFNRRELESNNFAPWCGFTSKYACLYANGFNDVCRWFPTSQKCYPNTYCDTFLPAKCDTLPQFCKWNKGTSRCDTIGTTNGGATIPPTDIYYTRFPTSKPVPPTRSPTDRPTTRRPTQRPASSPASSPITPGVCSWSPEVIANGGEFTPATSCASKTAQFGCKFRNFCCWDLDLGTCSPPGSCPECTGITNQNVCNAQLSCCTWDGSVGGCRRRCLGIVENVCG